MNDHKRFVLVHDIIHRRFVYLDIDKILAIEDKPIVRVDGDNKQAKAAIIMDTVDKSTNRIVIDETVMEFFTRISIGTGCIKINIKTPEMNPNRNDI